MTLGFGTAALGRPQYINIRQKSSNKINLEDFKNNGTKLLDEAYQLGMRYFDTAPGYGFAEQLLIDWLKNKNDDSIVIATKWGYTYVANFDLNVKIHEVKEHSLSKLNEQWKTSKAFGNYLKVYQIHSATLETGVLENNDILNQLAVLKNNHNLKIGITTTGANQSEVIKHALNIYVNEKPLFDAFQVTYNILEQSSEAILKTLIKQDKKIIIKEALANGRLFRNTNYNHYNKLYNTLEDIAKKHQVGLDVIALKFCQQMIPKSIVLSGASNIEQLKSNLQANTITLSKEELLKLKSYSVSPSYYWQERKQLAWN